MNSAQESSVQVGLACLAGQAGSTNKFQCVVLSGAEVRFAFEF
jgi:hypothetical protein